MPYDLKYGHVTLEDQRNVGDDEILFVLRGSDRLILPTLKRYYEECADADAPAHHLNAITANIRAIARWQEEHGTHVPQSIGFTPTT